jgi:serine/threonine protein kinase
MFREVTLETTSDIYVYREEDKIGAGGFGTVYLGKGLHDGRPVAIKRPHFYSEEALKKFRNKDCRYLPQLRHPYIVAVMAVLGEVRNAQGASGPPALIMEYVAGKSLDASWAGHIRFLSNIQRIALFHKICQGVAFAHSQGIVHRDLKPGNILLDAEKNPKIIDFGLAASLRPEDIRSLSQSHQFMGTLLYMAPEQYEAQAVDERADIYSLGLLLFFIFTGWHAKALLLKGEDTLSQMFDKYLPAEVALLTHKMCELDRGKRIHSVNTLLQQSDYLLHHSLIKPLSLLPSRRWHWYRSVILHGLLPEKEAAIFFSLGGMSGLVFEQLFHHTPYWRGICLALGVTALVLLTLSYLLHQGVRACSACTQTLLASLLTMFVAAVLPDTPWLVAAGIICGASTAVWVYRLYMAVV